MSISLEPNDLVDRVNSLRYPPTVWSHDWIYGLWYCGTSFQKAIYYGQFPSTLVKRVTTMFPPDSVKFLHACCGRCRIGNAVNIDRMKLPEVDIVADVENLPLKNESFDAVFIDPPYSEEDASRYKAPRLVNARRAMQEFHRILKPSGWLLWLDEKYPSYRRVNWKLQGLIGIVTGFERRTRVLSMFRKIA